MASPNEHIHHIKIRSTQMDMPTIGRSEDYDRKLRDTQEEIERIQQKREELERKKNELEELTNRKRLIVSQQVELTEKLTSSLTLIDRELVAMREESEDLEQCRKCFAAHLDKIQKLNPESWTRENIGERIDKASLSLDAAAEEYDHAAEHFDGTRSGAVFGHPVKKNHRRAEASSEMLGDFKVNFRNGLAYNLPILILGTLALIVYLFK